MRPIIHAGIFISIFFISCTGPTGPDGKNGASFLTLTTTDGTLYYYQDDVKRPGVTGGLQIKLDYPFSVSEGTYNFQYEARAYTSTTQYYYTDWEGTFEIWANKGQKGQKGGAFWQKGDAGEDGTNIYLTLVCNFYGSVQRRMGKESANADFLVPDSTYTAEMVSGEYRITALYHLQKYGVAR